MRKSIRKYAARPVDDALLDELLQQAERTQTMGNLQLYSVVVTRSDEMKRQLAPAHFNQPMVTQAPVVLTFCADYHRTTEWALRRGGHPGYDNLLSYQNAATDALLYCQRFCDLAEEAGLGLCFLGTTVYNPLSIIETLRLPALVMPVATITLGRDRRDHRPRLWAEGGAARKRGVCTHQRHADAGPNLHRHPLHRGRLPSHVRNAPRGAGAPEVLVGGACACGRLPNVVNP